MPFGIVFQFSSFVFRQKHCVSYERKRVADIRQHLYVFESYSFFSKWFCMVCNTGGSVKDAWFDTNPWATDVQGT